MQSPLVAAAALWVTPIIFADALQFYEFTFLAGDDK